MKSIIFVLLFALCVFKPVNAACRDNQFDYDPSETVDDCESCPPKCSTCSSPTICKVCATNSNRIAVTPTATGCM